VLLNRISLISRDRKASSPGIVRIALVTVITHPSIASAIHDDLIQMGSLKPPRGFSFLKLIVLRSYDN
jgi:hypothetical protein